MDGEVDIDSLFWTKPTIIDESVDTGLASLIADIDKAAKPAQSSGSSLAAQPTAKKTPPWRRPGVPAEPMQPVTVATSAQPVTVATSAAVPKPPATVAPAAVAQEVASPCKYKALGINVPPPAVVPADPPVAEPVAEPVAKPSAAPKPSKAPVKPTDAVPAEPMQPVAVATVARTLVQMVVKRPVPKQIPIVVKPPVTVAPAAVAQEVAGKYKALGIPVPPPAVVPKHPPVAEPVAKPMPKPPVAEPLPKPPVAKPSAAPKPSKAPVKPSKQQPMPKPPVAKPPVAKHPPPMAAMGAPKAGKANSKWFAAFKKAQLCGPKALRQFYLDWPKPPKRKRDE